MKHFINVVVLALCVGSAFADEVDQSGKIRQAREVFERVMAERAAFVPPKPIVYPATKRND